MSNAERGAAGEAFVAKRLAQRGYRILDRNWRTRGGEIDIVALDGDVLVFVEVRVRTGEHFGTADESVDRAKLSRLMAAGATYVSTHPSVADAIWRVDLVAVTLSPSGAVRAYNHYQNLTLD